MPAWVLQHRPDTDGTALRKPLHLGDNPSTGLPGGRVRYWADAQCSTDGDTASMQTRQMPSWHSCCLHGDTSANNQEATCEALLTAAGPGLVICCCQIAAGFRLPDWAPSILGRLSNCQPLNLPFLFK